MNNLERVRRMLFEVWCIKIAKASVHVNNSCQTKLNILESKLIVF